MWKKKNIVSIHVNFHLPISPCATKATSMGIIKILSGEISYINTKWAPTRIPFKVHSISLDVFTRHAKTYNSEGLIGSLSKENTTVKNWPFISLVTNTILSLVVNMVLSRWHLINLTTHMDDTHTIRMENLRMNFLVVKYYHGGFYINNMRNYRRDIHIRKYWFGHKTLDK